MKEKFIGVMGCVPTLPETFPIDMAENSGNMIHANAPLNMFSNSFYSKDPKISLSGNGSFRPFINNSASHLIVTMANTLVLGRNDGERYARFQRALEQYDKPIVVFGLGVQANGFDLENAQLPSEAIALIQFLSSKAELLGVRGEYTKLVLEKLCGVQNVFVTGCPSVFSRPGKLLELKENVRSKRNGRVAVNVTNLSRLPEQLLLKRAIEQDYFLIEPVSKILHQLHLDAFKTSDDFAIPSVVSRIYKSYSDQASVRHKLRSYFQSKYRLFRSVDPWYQFNEEHVSYTFGTRFHVNMASILSGVPALWLTHDARTKELVDFLHLPNLPLSHLESLTETDIVKASDYDDFFDHIGSLFDNFNEYLTTNHLPSIRNPF